VLVENTNADVLLDVPNVNGVMVGVVAVVLGVDVVEVEVCVVVLVEVVVGSV